MTPTLVMSPLSPLNPSASAHSFVPRASPRPRHVFPSSRPLRPFALGNHSQSTKPTKIIEVPKGFRNGFFVIDMTNEELARRA
ncbi:hypothetical protein BS47DRAFT_1335692 [Hydnum rufescens UP504]|uniref:Uncharacterized protein n=1 Tax=Hydnum rufescens UP504 TaxID=1448309 RepID=A0A9P6BAP1_9AGAM|nr:hypothetical protein BS47DRAFT_1335692 [Hydnum rufescens UP504]